MTDISVNVTNRSVPINGLAAAPQITVRRNDTGAVAAGPAAMTDRTADGLYTFAFAEVPGIDYSFLIDADPSVTRQVTRFERFYNGTISGSLSAVLLDTSIIEPIVSTNLDVAVSTRNAVVPLAAAADQAEHDATQAAIAALNDLSQADVQAALTAQGYTVARAGNLDNLDATVSSRATPADIAAALAGLNDISVADILTAVLASGDTVDLALSRLDNIDVDVATTIPGLIAALNDLSIADVQTALTNQGYTAARAPALDNLDVAVSTRNSVVPLAAAVDQAEHDATQAAIAALNDLSIADVQTALDNQGYTAARATNLDNLDVAVSTRSDHDENDVDTVLTAAHGAGSWQTGGGGPGLTQQDVRDAMKLAASPGAPAADSIDDKLDDLETQVGALNDISVADILAAALTSGDTIDDALSRLDNIDTDVSTTIPALIAALNDLSIADVQAALTAQGYTVARAANLDNLDVAVSSRNAVVPLAAATDQAEHDATQAAIAALNDLSSADVQAALTAQGYTPARAGNLDNLDATVSSRNSVVPLPAAVDQAEHDATQLAIAGLNDLSQADVQSALDAQGYTAARATNLDNLDTTVSSRSSHDENDVDTVLTAAHGAGSWQTGGGGPSLTQQQVRDAMKLTPSPGVPATDSIDEKLDDIENDTNTIEGLAVANLDAAVSSRATPADIAASEANVLAAVAALNDLSIADVQTALTAQGYTLGRATNLDDLDVPVSSRATVAGILAATLGSGESVDVALSRLDNIDLDVSTTIPALIAALNDLSIADVQTALDGQGYTSARAVLLDNLDQSISSVATAIAALNDISVADILAATVSSGNTVDAELSGILALRDFIEGGRDIDFTGSDALGWQRIERDIAGSIVRRYNLFDENGARINETVGSFIGRAGMISSEVPI